MTDTDKTADQTEAMKELAEREAQTAKQGRAAPTPATSSTSAPRAAASPAAASARPTVRELLELDLAQGMSDSSLFDPLLAALANQAGSSLSELQDRKKTPDAVRLGVEEQTSLCARLARKFVQQNGPGTLTIVTADDGPDAGAIAVHCEGPNGKSGGIILPAIPKSTPATSPATSSPKAASSAKAPPTSSTGAPSPTPAPSLAPPAVGLARPGVARRGAPRGPMR
jgi:hypothetical protein